MSFQQPSVCLECNGTGLRDTGGVYPWGEGIFADCGCAHTHEFRATGRPVDSKTEAEFRCTICGIVEVKKLW